VRFCLVSAPTSNPTGQVTPTSASHKFESNPNNTAINSSNQSRSLFPTHPHLMDSDSIQDSPTDIESTPQDNKHSYYIPDYVEIISRDISTRIGLALIWFIRCKSLEDDSFYCQSFSDQMTYAKNYATYLTFKSQDTIGLMNSMLFLPVQLEMPKCATQFAWADWSMLLGDD
jgi:hypothetical protein